MYNVGEIAREVKNYQLINNVWFPLKITEAIIAQLNQVKKEFTYENLEINTGIADTEFSP